MGERQIRLRYAGKCVVCATPLAAGTQAWWDGAARTVTCSACANRATQEASPAYVAGASAQREYDRRVGKREVKRAEAGLVRRAFMWRYGEPQSTTAWKQGAEGERRVGALLDELRAEDMGVFHDLQVPGSKANVDHVVVAPSGIHVIDPKLYKGKVELRDKGGFFRSDKRLFVGGRDRTKLVDKLATQVLVVEAATRDLRLPTVVTPVLCFVASDWALFAGGLELNGVRILWPKALLTLLRRPGPLSADHIQEASARIQQRLRPA